MKILRLYYLILFVSLFVSGCDKDEAFVAPEIKTTEVTEVTNTTAVINAEIIESGSEPILKYGFVWHEGHEDVSSLDDGTVEYMNGEPKEGKISFELKNLDQGKFYSYNAFVQTAKEIYMNRYGSGFEMAKPELTDISPKEGIAGTVITLTGKYLTANKDAISLKLGSKEVEILEASESEIKFIAPEGLSSNSFHSIELTANGVECPNELKFRYLPYFSLPVPFVRVGQYIAIQISLSFGGLDALKMTINGEPAEIIRAFLKDGVKGCTIIVKTSENIRPGEGRIEMSYGPYNVYNKSNELTILPAGTWEKKQNLPIESIGENIGFSKEGIGYVLSGDKLYQYNRINDTWNLHKEILSLNKTESDAIGLINEDLLILQGKTLKSYSFWGDYSQARAEFPGEKRKDAVNFVVNNTFYYGLGCIDDDYKNDFWKYDINKDEWTKLNDCSFNAVGKGVVRDGNVWVSKYLYDYKTDSFSESDDSIIRDDVHIVVNNSLFTMDRGNDMHLEVDENDSGVLHAVYEDYIDIYDYDFIGKRRIHSTVYPGESVSSLFTFSIDGKIYVGTGKDSIEFWEFTPAE